MVIHSQPLWGSRAQLRSASRAARSTLEQTEGTLLYMSAEGGVESSSRGGCPVLAIGHSCDLTSNAVERDWASGEQTGRRMGGANRSLALLRKSTHFDFILHSQALSLFILLAKGSGNIPERIGLSLYGNNLCV